MVVGVFGKNKILAVIPARKGSKRIKNKNSIIFNKKPMILHTINEAKKCKFFDKIIISTDSKKILDLGRKNGIHTPFLREEANDDYSSVDLATLAAIRQAESYFGPYDYVVQLMPNCPFRNKKTIEGAIKNFFKNNYKSQITFFEYNWANPWWAHYLKKNKIKKFFKNFRSPKFSRSQDLPKLFCPTGSVWISEIKTLKKFKNFYSPNYGHFIIDYKEAIDLDTQKDLEIAKYFIEK